jgi:hypothetical protein
MNKLKNRKTEFFKPLITINNEEFKINADKELGIYKEILTRFISQLDLAYSIHKRLLVYRFDLHLNKASNDNKIISRFMNRIKQWLKRHYGLDKTGYLWVREREPTKNQHYHLVLLLDGDKIRHPSKLTKALRVMWQPNGFMPTIQNPYYFIDKHNHDNKRKDVINRVSYLAKIRGKGYRSSQTKDYQTSRLKLNL